MKRKKAMLRALALVLCAALLTGSMPAGRAAGKVLLLEQAQNMALSNSTDITKKYNEITLQKVKYEESVEELKAKVKNKKSFRWTPLLSFKLPEQFDMVEEFELKMEPLSLQTEITNLQHELNDLRYEVLAEVNKLYVSVYVSQEKVAFTQQMLDDAQAALTRNEARLLTGDATQADVDTMSKRVETLTTELANLKRSFESEKQQLADMIGLDVTSGYTFHSPLKQLTLPRSELENVINYTLNNDHELYVAKATASTALMNLETYESLMRGHYGGDMDIIQGYINMAKQGQDVDYAAFQLSYKEFLEEIDRPWSFSIRILFFTFTMEWFKGEISGSRYIEDEMYAIYTACMEYANAKDDRDSVEEALRQEVQAAYEALVTAWNSYESMALAQEEMKDVLDKTAALNKLGKAEYSEVEDAQTNYQDAQMDALDALASYNEQLYDFDRLTCGAVTQYMSGVSLDAETGASGDSLVSIDVLTDPYYYIYTSVADLTFYVGVSIPEGYEPAITDFEVWSEGVQIGERTPVGQEVHHLTLDYGGTSTLVLRFYNGDTYVTECEIDASISRDVLELGGQSTQAETQEVVGTYSVTTTQMGDLSTSELTLSLNASLGARQYSITYGDQEVYTSEMLSTDETFRYLTLLIASLGDVTLNLYDREGNLLTTGRFDTETGQILADG